MLWVGVWAIRSAGRAMLRAAGGWIRELATSTQLGPDPEQVTGKTSNRCPNVARKNAPVRGAKEWLPVRVDGTGDRPTGPLHLGHFVGTLQNRVRLQDTHDTFILVADQHMLTTRLDRLSEIEANIREDVLGNLAVGVDPTKATIYLQSRVPETAELFLYLAMLVSVARAQRIPTLKDKLREMHVAQPSYGLLGYPILQAADILLVRGDVVPVGPDQAVPRRARPRDRPRVQRALRARVPCAGGLAPESGTLPGIDGSPKMSRSVGNTINLFDDAETVRAKVMSMYTDPTRLRATDPGHVEGNPVFAYHDAFNPDPDEVADLKASVRRWTGWRRGGQAATRRRPECLPRPNSTASARPAGGEPLDRRGRVAIRNGPRAQ